MELILKRILRDENYTLGRLYVASPEEGKPDTYLCNTLEPRWRDYANGETKVDGKSAIPEGRYSVVITWSPKFKQWLPLLVGDWAFNRKWQGVRIHAGNTVNDTEGCILPGTNTGYGMLSNSRAALKLVKQAIVEARDRNEAVWITIQ